MVVRVITRDGPKESSAVKRDVELLGNLEHPNVAKLIRVFREQKRALLVMEFCSGGLLSDIKEPLQEKRCKVLATQMLETLRYVHTRCAIKLLAARNFAFVHIGSDVVKLVDFVPLPWSKAQNMASSNIVSVGEILCLLLTGVSCRPGSPPHCWSKVSAEALVFASRLFREVSLEEALQEPWLASRRQRSPRRKSPNRRHRGAPAASTSGSLPNTDSGRLPVAFLTAAST